MRTLLPASLFLASLFLAALLRAAPPPAGEAFTYKHVGDKALRLEVYKPPGWQPSDRRPAIVFFHGGGWVQGSPGQFGHQSAYLAERGLVAISVQYRLMPKDTYERGTVPVACIKDAKSAFRWVRAHAATLGIDPARLGAGGGSAGGYLAAAIAFVPGFDDAADDRTVPLNPAVLILFNPALGQRIGDPVDPAQAERLGPRLDDFMKASPANHVRPGGPPTLIMHGEIDTTIPPAQMLRFQEIMRAAGNRCDVVLYPGQGHSFFNHDKAGGRNYTETMRATEQFLASLHWLDPAGK